ncbi:hypothetical protein ACTHPH_17355 [Paenibacillus pasadenensis]|uniref:hypothetical protein n=1 Tax=Paenibacillus pasadenensis TaxID=217090 RepID=UPI0003FC10E4|nr:hypothetical protein [Paenibacillus pasadenensis]
MSRDHAAETREAREPLSCSSVLAGGGTLYAATMGSGIYRKREEHRWERISTPEMDGLTVNRLVLAGERLHACTNRGLYIFDGEEWETEELELPVFQYRAEGGCLYACTTHGLWCSHGADWGSAAFADRKVYDIVNVPQYLILGCEKGLALYDRFSSAWMEFDLGAGVTSVAVCHGRLIGVSELGELVVGTPQHGFERYRYPGLFLFSIAVRGGQPLLCSDRGLYRAAWLGGRLALRPVETTGPVTDVDASGERLYLATLYEGIRQLDGMLPG